MGWCYTVTQAHQIPAPPDDHGGIVIGLTLKQNGNLKWNFLLSAGPPP